MNLKKIRQLVQSDLQTLDETIQRRLQIDIPFLEQCCHYVIDGGGKRLRPLLVILAAHAGGYTGDHHITLAAATEFFHTATLFHDDVIDQSTLRRGKQTANAKWGNKSSVLIGDYLFTLAFQLIISLENPRITALFTETANVMTQGEISQLLNAHSLEINETHYMQIIARKTAALFATAAQLGALLNARPEKEIEAYRLYGFHLGNAFQLVDDVLDYCASSQDLGKNAGDDLAEGKMTLPVIYGLQRSGVEEKKILEETITQKKFTSLSQVCAILQETNAINDSNQAAFAQAEQAIAAISSIPVSPYRDGLIALAHFVCERAF